MAHYRARLQGEDADTEGVYDFEERPDLLHRPADEVVEAFMAHANRHFFGAAPVRYELNGVMRHNNKNVVVGMGTLTRDEKPISSGDPFTIIINHTGD